MQIVRCQNPRGRCVTHQDKTKVYLEDATCLHIMGRIAEIDPAGLRAAIKGVVGVMAKDALQEARAVDALVTVFCGAFRASYWCPACHDFMDVQFNGDRYETRVTVPAEVNYDRIMNPKVVSHQLEVK